MSRCSIPFASQIMSKRIGREMTVFRLSLKASMQRRARKMRDRRLQSVKTVIERQQGVPSEGDDHGLFFLAENGRAWLCRPRLSILDRLPLAPLGESLDVDAQFPAQRRGRSLRSLYESSDRVRPPGRLRPPEGRLRGAAVKNCPIAHPSIPSNGSNHQTVGSNT